MAKKTAHGEPRTQGVWSLQEARGRPQGISWWRLTGPGVNRLIGPDDLFDLTELLDDACDLMEDRIDRGEMSAAPLLTPKENQP